MADSSPHSSGIPVSIGIANPPSDSLEENLVDRMLFAEECSMAANILLDHFVAKYGSGFVPADKSKGQKGVVASLDFRDRDKLDVEMNYLLKSFIFSSKSSIDKGLHLLYVMRSVVQPGKVGSAMPDPNRPKGFGRFIDGVFEKRFDNLHPVVEGYYRKWADAIIPLRIARNNIKEFGKANFEINMGRPCWKFALTTQNATDGSLKHSSAFKTPAGPVTTMTITLDFVYSVIAGELDHLLMITQLVDAEAESHGAINAASVQRISALVSQFDQKIARHALRLDIPAL